MGGIFKIKMQIERDKQKDAVKKRCDFFKTLFLPRIQIQNFCITVKFYTIAPKDDSIKLTAIEVVCFLLMEVIL